MSFCEPSIHLAFVHSSKFDEKLLFFVAQSNQWRDRALAMQSVSEMSFFYLLDAIFGRKHTRQFACRARAALRSRPAKRTQPETSDRMLENVALRGADAEYSPLLAGMLWRVRLDQKALWERRRSI